MYSQAIISWYLLLMYSSASIESLKFAVAVNTKRNDQVERRYTACPRPTKSDTKAASALLLLFKRVLNEKKAKEERSLIYFYRVGWWSLGTRFELLVSVEKKLLYSLYRFEYRLSNLNTHAAQWETWKIKKQQNNLTGVFILFSVCRSRLKWTHVKPKEHKFLFHFFLLKQSHCNFSLVI